MATSRSWSASASVRGSRRRALAAKLTSRTNKSIFAAVFIFFLSWKEKTLPPEGLGQTVQVFFQQPQPQADLLRPGFCACFPEHIGIGADESLCPSFFFWF